jgi:hypothetical protein
MTLAYMPSLTAAVDRIKVVVPERSTEVDKYIGFSYIDSLLFDIT